MLANRMRMCGREEQAGYQGVVELGTLLFNGNELPRPTRPWRNSVDHSGLGEEGDSGAGNIPARSGTNLDSYSFGDTSADPANRLRWHKFIDKVWDQTIYICDRNIVRSVSWNHINATGYVFGITVVIDGKQFVCRLLGGGYGNRGGGTGGSYAGGHLPNEWDRYIMNNADNEDINGHVGPYFAEAPVPTPADWDEGSVLNDPESIGREHNQLWWWNSMYSWVHEQDVEDSAGRAIRGGLSVRYWERPSAATGVELVGWRPALVEL